MDYRAVPFGNIWSGGIFNVPVDLVDKYIKMTSEYQLKALLFVLRNGGQSDTAQIAKALGQTQGDIDDLMEFWVEEGILSVDGKEPAPAPKKQEAPAQVKVVKEVLSPPTLTPKDIVDAQRENEHIAFLLNEAQVILGRTVSHAEQEMLVNMVNYYGLRVEVIMMILEFYRSEKERGKAIGIAYVNAMAKNWADEGVETISDAEEKLQEIAKSDRLWNEIVAITGIRHRRPNANQRKMIADWFSDFDITMITLAADIMKEKLPGPRLDYMDSIIKNWRKKGIKSPAQVKADQEEFAKKKEDKKKQKKSASYDLEKIMESAIDNTDII